MKEQFVRLSDVEDMLDNARLVTDETCLQGYCMRDVKVDKLPVVDVEPVRHGRWIELKNDPVFQEEYDDNKRVYYCAKCNRYITIDADVLAEYGDESLYEEFPYCHCGAKMDEKVEK